MTYLLILLFFGCALKDGASLPATLSDPPARKYLNVYWNVPTFQCGSKNIQFENLQRFGIIQNSNDSFRGEHVAIIYDTGLFPTLKYDSKKLNITNGGLPQEGDLKKHLEVFTKVINESIPDENFSGIGVLNFELWRPIFRQNFGVLTPHKSASLQVEEVRSWWSPHNETGLEAEARKRFEEAAKSFMQSTLSLAKRLRSRARWGYYAFPYCFNMRKTDMKESCAPEVDVENDKMDWLWDESTALYPSVYSDKMSTSEIGPLIRGRVREASRVRRNDTPILPYFLFRFEFGGKEFLTEENLHMAFDTLLKSDATGFIIWGGSEDVNTIERCEKLLHYVNNILGPVVANYTTNNYYKQDLNIDVNTTAIKTVTDKEENAIEDKHINNTLNVTKDGKEFNNTKNVEMTVSLSAKEAENRIKTPHHATEKPDQEPTKPRYLDVYWNIPTFQCTSKKVPFKNLHRFGIIQNTNDLYRGDKIALMYDTGLFPELFNKTGKFNYTNGGIPQEGDLEKHLEQFKSVLNKSIPDEDFSGIGVIDFEGWRPVFRQNFGEFAVQKKVSLQVEQFRRWWSGQTGIESQAKDRFEEAAKSFMQSTISLAKQLRPRARWGFYGFPYCFNMHRSDMQENCSVNTKNENSRTDWLWSESTALYPSVYARKLNTTHYAQLIRGSVLEATRLKKPGTAVLPYFSHTWSDDSLLSEEDLHVAFKTLQESGASGFILWGQSRDFNTKEKCTNFLHHLDNVLGPIVAKYTKNDYYKKAAKCESVSHMKGSVIIGK